MHNVKTIFLKELKRLFTDKRMLIALFLPGILVFALYEIIGHTITNIAVSTPENATYSIAYTDNSGSSDAPLLVGALEAYVKSYEPTNAVVASSVSSDDVKTVKQEVMDGKEDVLIVFSDNFESNLTQNTGSSATNTLSFYYNGADENALHAYSLLSALVGNVYDRYSVTTTNVATNNALSTRIMGFIFPMVTISMLFSSVMTISPEAIAGEKERGTLAATLLTPIRTSELTLGKIFAVSIAAVASGVMSFLGLFLSLPALTGQDDFFVGANGAFALLFLIVSSLLLFVSLGMVVSCFAKTVKEANSYMGPLLSVLMLAGFLPALLDVSPIGFSLIPFFNIGNCMYLIITQTTIPYLYLGLTIGINLVLMMVFVFLTGKLLSNEKVIFSR